jgi:deoxyuridine 5'-triphosphate nucleotidohydrolase
MDPPLKVKKLSEDATLPTKGSVLSAGFDLSASRPATIPPGGRGIVHTDLSIACPPGTYARIAPRSGLAVKKGIDCGAGVIDADYRGPLGVVLFNLDSENVFEVKKGDRIAQLILEKISYAGLEEVEDLDATDRGASGFGSTGVSVEQEPPITKKAKTDTEEKKED